MVRILFITHQFLPYSKGGTETYTFDLAKKCIQKGHKVLVLAGKEVSPESAKISKLESHCYEGVESLFIPYNLSVYQDPLKATYQNDEIIHFFEQVYRDFKPDIVHFTHLLKVSISAVDFFTRLPVKTFATLTDYWALCPNFTLLKWNEQLCNGPTSPYECAKCIQHSHGIIDEKINFFPNWMISLFFRGIRWLPNRFFRTLKLKNIEYHLRLRNQKVLKALLKLDHLIALSNFQLQKLISLGIPPELIKLIPHGLDPFEVKKKDKSEIVFGLVGSMVPHKGVLFGLKAFKSCNFSNARLLVYGEILSSNSYHQLVLREMKDEPSIEYKGVFEPTDLPLILENIDIFLFPVQWYENDPYMLKAAIMAKIPVLASDIGSIKDWIIPNKNGWLLPRDQLKDWVAAMKKVVYSGINLSFQEHPPIPTLEEHFRNIYPLYHEK